MADDDAFVDGDNEPRDPFDPAQAANAADRATRERDDASQKLVDNLRRRQEAYRRVFSGQPMGDDVRVVVEDLKAFCRGETTTFDADPRVHALLTGRQEVYLRIMDHWRLDFDTFLQKYTRPLDER